MRIEGDDVLFGRSSHDEEIRDSWNGRNLLSQYRFRVVSEVGLAYCGIFGGKSYPDYFSQQCTFWSYCRMYRFWEVCVLESFKYLLPVDEGFCFPAEFHVDD